LLAGVSGGRDVGPVLRRTASFLNCPRCGLSIRPRADWLTVEYCPRCIARTRTLVHLFSSTLPPAELYAADSVPHADARGGTTTVTGRSR
jgi:hypothetical protein